MHSPTPWHYEKTFESPNLFYLVDNNDETLIHKGRVIGLDNARLMAAAPKLLEALQKIADHKPGYTDGDATATSYDCWACEEMNEIARAAIAAVKGEQG